MNWITISIPIPTVEFIFSIFVLYACIGSVFYAVVSIPVSAQIASDKFDSYYKFVTSIRSIPLFVFFWPVWLVIIVKTLMGIK